MAMMVPRFMGRLLEFRRPEAEGNCVKYGMMRRRQRRERKRQRCAAWNYASRGVYFVTIVVRQRIRLLSAIHRGAVRLSRLGQIVDECWHRIPTIHVGVRLDRFVVMPDHIHGLLWLDNPLRPLDQIIGGYKSATARGINQLRGHSGPGIWQRGYHDRIIRTRRELHAVRAYIDNNPSRWAG
jgi:REP element-mobilizing transposase RayT